ncbi:DUF2958 domain-containing protein [Blastococcus sp. TF02A-26]|nr:DUF2958 domain-containing protein [Blastococcus sp. TF02A-26]
MSRPEIHRERRGHEFYPKPGTTPGLHRTERIPLRERVVTEHYFFGSCDWWVIEYDEEEALAFGYACLSDPISAEWGYVSLAELEQLLICGRNVVERDLYWRPRPAGDCRLPGWPF